MIGIEAMAIVLLAIVHLLAGRLRFMHRTPRSQWLSFAGGISVAYVFVHIFPELAKTQEDLGGERNAWPWVEHHAYLVAMIGLILFYGLERVVITTRDRRGPESAEQETDVRADVFWLHIGSFLLYNGLIGYLLARRDQDDLSSLLTYAFAMALHFFVNDYGLRKSHRRTYDRLGRWWLVAGLAGGWVLGMVTEVGVAATGVLFALLAGGVILNVLKEEVPAESQSRFWPFAVGAAAYAALLLAL